MTAVPVNSPLKIFLFVGDDVRSLKYLRFLKAKLETPYVVSYFFNKLLTMGMPFP
jgi:hypothetical protein